jgi:hypothetical protein
VDQRPSLADLRHRPFPFDLQLACLSSETLNDCPRFSDEHAGINRFRGDVVPPPRDHESLESQLPYLNCELRPKPDTEQWGAEQCLKKWTLDSVCRQRASTVSK